MRRGRAQRTRTSPRGAQDASRQWPLGSVDRDTSRGALARAGQRHTPALAQCRSHQPHDHPYRALRHTQRRAAPPASGAASACDFKSRRPRNAGLDRRGLRLEATSIGERPSGIGERLVPGHRECDLINRRETNRRSAPGGAKPGSPCPWRCRTPWPSTQRSALALCSTDLMRPCAKAWRTTSGVRWRTTKRCLGPPASRCALRTRTAVRARHQQERQRCAAPPAAQGHRPERAQPSRSGRHCLASQRQAA